jgi:hypothetical protein
MSFRPKYPKGTGEESLSTLIKFYLERDFSFMLCPEGIFGSGYHHLK